MSRSRTVLLFLACALAAAACSGRGYGGNQGTAAVFPSGGAATVGAAGREAFGFPAPGVTQGESTRFQVGDEFFSTEWVPAGGTDDRDGLGPTYLAASCITCHEADGKGDRPTPASSSGSIILVADAGYGEQIQDRAVAGARPEALVRVDVVAAEGGLTRPEVAIESPAFGAVEPRSLIVAPHLIGLGLLEAVPGGSILAAADPSDRDGDGISGRANVVWSPVLGRAALGRFGWKANRATVADQVAFAFLEDMGITSPVYPDENCPEPQTRCAEAPAGGSPEIGEDRFGSVVLYAQTLAVPARRRVDEPAVQRGEALFTELGCAACHTPSLETGRHEIAALSGQTIYPYTDLLLHDMGLDLADERIAGLAVGSEWRTPPLWGIGLVQRVNPQAGFLHDGRAATLDEAIRWHGGEATAARAAYTALDDEQRAHVVAFLGSL